MEYFDGGSLGDLIRARGPFSADQARDYLSQLLAGLQALHDAGLVHRDVKPANLLLTSTPATSPILKLADLGVTRNLASKSAMTLPSTLLGTPE